MNTPGSAADARNEDSPTGTARRVMAVAHAILGGAGGAGGARRHPARADVAGSGPATAVASAAR